MSERANLSNTFNSASNKNQTVTKAIKETADLQTTNAVANSSKLGSTLGEKIGGFELIASNVDDVIASVPNSLPKNIFNDQFIAIAKMNSDVVGQSEKLVQDISSSISSDLQKSSNNSTLTAPGQLDVVTTAVTPEAISAATKAAISSISEDELLAVTSVTTDVNNVELPRLAEQVSVSSHYKSSTNPQGDVASALEKLPKRSTLKSTAGKNINSLSSQSTSSYKSLLSDTYSNTVDIEAASIVPFSNDSEAIKAMWSEGDATGNYWNNVDVSPEEFKSELLTLKRQITEIVILSSNTGKDLFIDAKRIFDIEKANNNKVPPIHYVISPNVIERLLPVDIEAEQSTILPYNHHQNSIVVMLVGGIKGPHPKETENFVMGNTYSASQLNNLATMFKIAYENIPGIQIFGSDLLQSPKKGPHIDIVQFTKTRFDRGLVNKDLTQGPYTADEIVNARI